MYSRGNTEYKSGAMTVVFLPYCASMWDSMAEYYEEYKRKSFNVLVMPIPYYGKNSDREFDTMYYDGDKFRELNICSSDIVDYKQIDLQEFHPHTIFIHNGYDNMNIITSVDPAYYSSKLLDCTNNLIYVPYFTSEYVAPHFINVPGAKNATKIIVESELQKRQYLDVLGAKNIEVRRSSKEWCLENSSLIVPDEWKKKIGKKKVVFFNTGLISFLDRKNSYLLEMTKDIMSFRNIEDAILLWRPHPLLRQTIIATAPDMVDEYDRIVEWYKKEEVGIYDDSPDLQRALLLADEYYGDPSSLMFLFNKMKKPVKIR